jgi:hypothetical protein
MFVKCVIFLISVALMTGPLSAKDRAVKLPNGYEADSEVARKSAVLGARFAMCMMIANDSIVEAVPPDVKEQCPSIVKSCVDNGMIFDALALLLAMQQIEFVELNGHDNIRELSKNIQTIMDLETKSYDASVRNFINNRKSNRLGATQPNSIRQIVVNPEARKSTLINLKDVVDLAYFNMRKPSRIFDQNLQISIGVPAIYIVTLADVLMQPNSYNLPSGYTMRSLLAEVRKKHSKALDSEKTRACLA